MMIRKLTSPPETQWRALFTRPVLENNLKDGIAQILMEVRKSGDEALFKYSERFDGVRPESLRVSDEEIDQAGQMVPEDLKLAIRQAIENIAAYHRIQVPDSTEIETMPGIRAYQVYRPIDKVGLYIPGGTAPLLSTLMMLGIPANIAQCPEIVVCTPPDKHGQVHPAILYIAQLLDIRSIFKVGGAQAIAAMAYGTQSIPRVFKIFGPGNSFVTQAKELVQLDGVSIDMPAGPSELLVYADATAEPDFIASDLLSQAEHGPDSQVVLVTDDEGLLNRTEMAIRKQLDSLPRREIALQALENSCLILEPDFDKAFKLINAYAPEHLILACESPGEKVGLVRNAGSIFLGSWSAEAIGDYAAGPNHTLPTNHHARAYSGVSVMTFMKRISVQEVTEEGIRNIGKTVETLAASEDLIGHQRAVSIRLASLQND